MLLGVIFDVTPIFDFFGPKTSKINKTWNGKKTLNHSMGKNHSNHMYLYSHMTVYEISQIVLEFILENFLNFPLKNIRLFFQGTKKDKLTLINALFYMLMFTDKAKVRTNDKARNSLL